MRLLLSKRQWQLVGLVILVIVAGFVCCAFNAQAAEKPQYFAALSALYAERLGIGGGVGYQFKSGVFLLGQATYTYADGSSGTVPFQVGCQTYQVPWSTGSRGSLGAAVTVAIPIRRRER